MKSVNEYIEHQLTKLVAFVWQSKYEEQIQSNSVIEDENFFIHICTVGELLANEKIRKVNYEYVELVASNIKGNEEDMLMFVISDKLNKDDTKIFSSTTDNDLDWLNPENQDGDQSEQNESEVSSSIV